MITPDNLTRKKAKKLLRLITEMIRCDVMSRIGPVTTSEAVDYFDKKIEKENEICVLLFDTHNMIKLGKMWGMIKKKSKNSKL